MAEAIADFEQLSQLFIAWERLLASDFFSDATVTNAAQQWGQLFYNTASMLETYGGPVRGKKCRTIVPIVHCLGAAPGE
jgi:hypothetical protein